MAWKMCGGVYHSICSECLGSCVNPWLEMGMVRGLLAVANYVSATVQASDSVGCCLCFACWVGSYGLWVWWVFTRSVCLLVIGNKQQASMVLELLLRVAN